MLLALLLVTRAAAEWVEISQQHYRKPVRPTTTVDGTTRNTYQDVHPKKDTYLYQEVLHSPARDTYLNHNAQNPMRSSYQDVMQDPTRSTLPSNEVFLQKPVREDFISLAGSPQNPTRKTYFDENIQPVRINPFLHDNITIQTPIRNTYLDQDVPHQSPTRDTYKNKRLESTTKETYPNHSITEHNWNQNMHRQGNGQGDAKVMTSQNKNAYRPNNEWKDEGKLEVTDNAPNIVRIKDETVSGKIERVTNIGSVKRVQLADTPVKSPALNTKFSENTSNRRNDVQTYETPNYDNFSDELNIETDIFNSHEHTVSKTPSTSNKQDLSSDEEVFTHMDTGKTKVPNDETKIPVPSLPKHSFTRKPDVTDKVFNVLPGVSRFKQNSVPENIESTFEHKVVSTVSSAKMPLQPNEEFTTDDDTKIPELLTKKTVVESPKEVKIDIEKNERAKIHRESVKLEKIHKVDEKEASSENGENINSSSGEIKVNTMENILKFMKVVTDTISKNTRRGANGKITYLNELKHTLLTNIKDRIDATWPDDDAGAAGRRRSRSASPRGHVEFPSSESALMTISFLTFAVFLIKLVLQVIQTYKHKTMVMAPLMVATAGRAVTNKLRAN